MDYLYPLPFEDGYDLIVTAINAHQEEQIKFRWIVCGYEKRMSYQEFKNLIIQPVGKSQSKEEILKSVQSLFMGGDDQLGDI